MTECIAAESGRQYLYHGKEEGPLSEAIAEEARMLQEKPCDNSGNFALRMRFS